MSAHDSLRPGFYWAKLVNPTRMPDGEEWASVDWEVVQVNDNYGEGDETLSVSVPGISPCQWPKDFEWGPRIEPPASLCVGSVMGSR